MEVYQGKSVFGGIAIGRISVHKKDEQQVKRVRIEDPEQEILRYRQAKQTAMEQLQGLYQKALKEVGEANAAIFEIHQMMLEDDDYNESVENIIRMQQVNAEYVADDLAPSETVQLNKDLVLSFVTVHGSVNSHTAILARTMSIPALIGTAIPLTDDIDGKVGIVDGKNGCIYVDPDEDTLGRMQQLKLEEQEKKELLQTLKGRENITIDGKKIMLYANIGNSKDLAAVLQNDAGGIGLFRSEFIYLERDTFPTEEEQFQIYRTVAETMAGKPVIIRTLDIGADKKCDYFEMEPEENPAMGCRAIRICLTRPEIFKTQLRALFRASAFGNISIMYPMIISVDELRKIKTIVAEIRQELTEQGVTFGEPKQGIMIETPAAVMMSEELAKEVDFFSIGTNDLTQYTLAIDRQNPKLDAFYEPHHPAVLRMIQMVVENAHKAGIWAGICGELGADTTLTRRFLAMGVDELSMSPGSILPVRKIILETDVTKERENNNLC